MKRIVFLLAVVVGGFVWVANRTAVSPKGTVEAATASPAPAISSAAAPGVPAALQAPTFQDTVASKQPAAAAANAAPAPPDASAAAGAATPRRAWDPAWLQGFAGQTAPWPVKFELVNGEMAEGEVIRIQEQDGQVMFLAGRLSKPEEGSFFFRKQSLPGLAGSHVGVVQFPGSERAFRLEPTGADGAPELLAHRLDEVVCLRYAMPPGPGTATASSASDPAEAPVVDVGQHPTIPTPDYQNGIPVFESLPNAKGVMYLDFDGESTTQWDGHLIVAKRPSFTAADIKDIWRRVSEDYLPFTVNVTTDLRVYERAAENSRIHVIITPTTDAAPGAGGVAWIGSWNWTGDTPCWAFGSKAKDAAEQISHEVGHTLGLGHDGRPGEGYYGGHGSGETGWAPIMGVAYGQPVGQWSKGEYANASNTEDDLRVITTGNTAVLYKSDDFGGTFATAAYLELFGGGVITNRGIIERNTDIDAFRFTTGGGAINVTAKPAGVSPNLAIRLDLVDATDQILLTVSPATTLRATLSTNLPAGAYAIKVRGAGRGANATVGFTSYASLGYYQLSGTVIGGVEPIRLVVQELAPNGTVVGDLNTLVPGTGERTFAVAGGTGAAAFAVAPNGEVTVAQTEAVNFEVKEQFDLLVNIDYPGDPALNESNRRVVVRVADVNETPVLADAHFYLYGDTRRGTIVGALTSSDPDLYTRLRFSVAAGDDTGLFGVNGSGQLYLRQAPAAEAATFQLRVDAWDAGNPVLTNSANVVVDLLAPPGGLSAGAIAYARYDNITGLTMANLTNNAAFPRSPTSLVLLTNAEIPAKTADHFGGAMRGYLLPPVTGSYTFAVAGDDASELWLSTTDQPANRRRIAYSTTATDPRKWNQSSTQRSTAIALEAGKAYYLEAFVKEGEGNDHLAVAWSSAAAGITALQVIPGRYLAPYDQNFAPLAVDQTLRVHRDAFAQARFGRVQVTDAAGDAVFTYSLVSSTVPGLIGVDTSTGWLRVKDAGLLARTSATAATLRVRTMDEGGLAATSVITCQLVAASSVAATQPFAEVFKNIGSSTAVSALTSNTRYPRRPDELRPLTQFALDRNTGDYYGTRVRTLVVAPASGTYHFYLASDDGGELWFSTSTNPASAKVVARVTGSVGFQSWTDQNGQESTAQSLTAGQVCYLETRHKEGAGEDHLSVAWTTPGSTTPIVIPGSALRPVDLGFAPSFSGTTASVESTATNGTVVATLAATDSPVDFLAWRIAEGDAEGVFAIDPDAGTLTVASHEALAASTNLQWQLTVQVQDSGYNDWFPRQRTSATVTVDRIQTATPYELWVQAAGLANADPSADADADGVPNLLEFAFGGSPTQADADALHPRVALVGENAQTYVQLVYRHRTDAASAGLTYFIEGNSSLDNSVWSPAAATLQSATQVAAPNGGGYEEETFRIQEPVPAEGGARFFRVRVTLNGTP